MFELLLLTCVVLIVTSQLLPEANPSNKNNPPIVQPHQTPMVHMSSADDYRLHKTSTSKQKPCRKQPNRAINDD